MQKDCKANLLKYIYKVKRKMFGKYKTKCKGACFKEGVDFPSRSDMQKRFPNKLPNEFHLPKRPNVDCDPKDAACHSIPPPKPDVKPNPLPSDISSKSDYLTDRLDSQDSEYLKLWNSDRLSPSNDSLDGNLDAGNADSLSPFDSFQNGINRILVTHDDNRHTLQNESDKDCYHRFLLRENLHLKRSLMSSMK